VSLSTDGRPLDATVELWDGPGNTPVSMHLFGDDGRQRPVHAAVRGRQMAAGTVAVRNTGPMEFPLAGSVAAGMSPPTARPSTAPPAALRTSGGRSSAAMRIQGGAEEVIPVDGAISSIEIHLASEGGPITARIEILQGPNTCRQGIALYSDDGCSKPITYLLETPGYGCSVQIDNTGPMEYPLVASVLAHSLEFHDPDCGDAMGGGAVLGGEDLVQRRSRYGSLSQMAGNHPHRSPAHSAHSAHGHTSRDFGSPQYSTRPRYDSTAVY